MHLRPNTNSHHNPLRANSQRAKKSFPINKKGITTKTSKGHTINKKSKNFITLHKKKSVESHLVIKVEPLIFTVSRT